MTGSIHTKEPDPDRARSIALDGLILHGLVGSTVHGLGNPATDDRDEMGICVEPPENVVGLRRFDHYVSRTQPDGVPSGPGDLDLTVYGLRDLAASGNRLYYEVFTLPWWAIIGGSWLALTGIANFFV